jgi:hypothetical protein
LGDAPVRRVEFNSQGTLLLCMSGERRCTLTETAGDDWYLTSSTRHRDLLCGNLTLKDVCFLHNRSEIAGLGENNELHVFANELWTSRSLSVQFQAERLAFLNKCTVLAIALNNGEIVLFDYPSLQPLAREYMPSPVTSIAGSMQDSVLTVGCESGQLSVLSLIIQGLSRN